MNSFKIDHVKKRSNMQIWLFLESFIEVITYIEMKNDKLKLNHQKYCYQYCAIVRTHDSSFKESVGYRRDNSSS